MRNIAPTLAQPKKPRRDDLSVEELAKFFSEVGRKDNQEKNPEIKMSDKTDNIFKIEPATETAIEKIINNMSTHKSAGIDEIPMKAIKMGTKSLLRPLTKLVNSILKLGFPKQTSK